LGQVPGGSGLGVNAEDFNPARSITSKEIQLIGRKQGFNTLV